MSGMSLISREPRVLPMNVFKSLSFGCTGMVEELAPPPPSSPPAEESLHRRLRCSSQLQRLANAPESLGGSSADLSRCKSGVPGVMGLRWARVQICVAIT
jgi:hypothetical protein